MPAVLVGAGGGQERDEVRTEAETKSHSPLGHCKKFGFYSE